MKRERIFHLKGEPGVATLLLTLRGPLVGSKFLRCEARWSFCTNNDTFERKKGVEIARSKLWKEGFYIENDQHLLKRFGKYMSYRYAAPAIFFWSQHPDLFGFDALLALMQQVSKNKGQVKVVF